MSALPWMLARFAVLTLIFMGAAALSTGRPTAAFPKASAC